MSCPTRLPCFDGLVIEESRGRPPEVLYEDEDVIAVHKSAGDLVVPGRGPEKEETLRQRLARAAGGKVFVVHRLDRDTSGVVVFAKNEAAHRALSGCFERREVEKVYRALVLGRVEADSGEIDRPIRAFGSGRMGADPRGKPSVTRFRVLKRFPRTTLLEIEPLTGRRHQIRVHLYSLGHPVLGDGRYGAVRPLGGAPRLMLHAWRIAFARADGRRVEICAALPPDFQFVLERAAAGEI